MTNALLLCITILLTVRPSHGDPTNMDPMKCSRSSPIQTCKSTLYIAAYNGLSKSNVASIYSANKSLIDTIVRQQKHEDFLAQVPCQCEDIGGGITAYFHDTNYTVKAGDSSDSLTRIEFSGLAWNINATLDPGQNLTVHLLCACDSKSNSNSNSNSDGRKDIVSYTVQKGDTLSTIADLLLADVEVIKSLNGKFLTNPDFLIPGYVLFVPMGTAKDGDIKPGKKKRDNIALILGITFSIAFIVLGVLLAIYRNWKQSHKKTSEPPKMMERNTSLMSIAALENQYHHKDNMQDIEQTDTERPIIFSLSDVEKATLNFDETRMIGEGGFGHVYYGLIGNQEVAIKRMKSSKSKEFFAELKVLCKIHHINVVELIGYASGDDHLYLVYEYVRYGSLNDHLHDPLLKGHQPLSWNARTQIALDAARGIEYIHDHTKAHYVHRDIKTSNILLDEGLRAKVADFGLVKLVERSSEDDCMATRLVGTPGYLPPESVRELQMTSKGDVFAFGVVLAELITGCHALMRDNKEERKMKSLISVMRKVFEEDDPEVELEAVVDGYLGDNYPMEQVYKMAEISVWCLDEEPVDRPEMREITVELSQLVMASKEWEASLAGDGLVFSGVFDGR